MSRSTALAFVETIAAETGNGQFARWDHRICLNVEGLPADQQRYFTDRIATVGRQLGLQITAERACEPSVYVIFTPEPARLLATIEAARPNFFGGIDAAERADFMSSVSPVRSLSYAQLRGPNGEQPLSFNAVQNPTQDPERPAPSTRTTPSRLSTGFRMDLRAMIVMVDTSRIHHVSFRSLSAYLSAVIFGNMRNDPGPVRVPSILGIFEEARINGSVVTTDLTQWDLAYLTSLYRGSWNMPFEQMTANIAIAMTRDLGGEGDP